MAFDKKWLVVVLVVLGGWLYWGGVEITVTGIGEVEAKPSLVTIGFTVAEVNNDAAAAAGQAKLNANNLRKSLVASGVDDKDIVESPLRMVPESSVNPRSPGYRAILSMGLSSKNTDNVDGLVAAIYRNGAAFVSQPVLTVEDKELEKQAISKAMKDASEKAKNSGVRWGVVRKIVRVSHNSAVGGGVVTGGENSESSNGAKMVRSVNVTYRLW